MGQLIGSPHRPVPGREISRELVGRKSINKQKRRILSSDYIPEERAPGCYHLGMLTAGFVLVGGQSRRMGRDKALLPWNTGVLVQDVAAKLAAVTGSVTLIGDPARYAHLQYPCLPDRRPGLGPLSGIETALESARGEVNLILACDMPHIDVAHLRSLLAAALDSEEECLVTEDASGVIHPLCAAYRSTCLPAVRKALDEGRLKLMSLVGELKPKLIPVPVRLSNINTAEDWSAARAANGY